MTKQIAILCLCASSCFGQLVTTRVNERAIAGLTSALDTLESSAVLLTNSYVREDTMLSYVSNKANTYVSQFLPSLITYYTYPFTTDGVVFADDTTQTFGRLAAQSIDTDELDVDKNISTSGTADFDDAYLWNTYSISNLLSDTVSSSWNTQIGNLSTTSAEFSGDLTELDASSVRATSVVAPDGYGDAMSTGTNTLLFTGDVFITVDTPILDHYRNPILVKDPVSGNTWYDPAFVRPDGMQVSLASAVELRSFPRALGTNAGYSILDSVSTNRVPLFSYGPPGVTAPTGTGFTTVLHDTWDTLRSAYAIPAASAGLPFYILTAIGPSIEFPLFPSYSEFPDLPPLVPLWVAPDLPDIISYPAPSPALPEPVPSPTYSGLFYDYNVYQDPSVTLDTLSTPLTYSDVFDMFYDPDIPDAHEVATRAAVEYCHDMAVSWYGSGPSIGTTDVPLDKEIVKNGFLIYPAATVLVGITRTSGDLSGSIEAIYERQMYGCAWVSSVGTPMRIVKISQTFGIRTSKYAEGPGAWWNVFWNVVAYKGSYTKSGIGSYGYGDGYMGNIVETDIGEGDLPSNRVYSARASARATAPEIFYASGDTAYAFDNYGSTYRVVYDSTMASGVYVTYYVVDSGTSIYDLGVPDYLARQFIYEDLGDGVRTARSLERHYQSGNWTLWQDRTALYAQRTGSPSLRFLRHYDGIDTPVMDVSNDAFPFVVDLQGSPGESGFGSDAVEYLFTTSLAEEVASVVPSRDATTGVASYAVTVRKRRPQ